MYYQITDLIDKISLEEINPDILTVGIISLEELEQCYEVFGFSYLTVAACKSDEKHLHGALNSYFDYLFGILIGINPLHIMEVQDRLAIFIKRNLFLIVIIEDKDESTKDKLYDLLQHMNLSNMTLERLIFGFLERFINESPSILAKLEEEISTHEDKIDDRDLDKDFNNKITDIRKELLLLDNYYQQFAAVGEELEENAADLFAENKLHYFRIFADRALRLSNNTRMLQEYCVHVREAYHARLEYDLNRIMKMFTVVTTIFLPLTLIVGWYGMNFTTMPEITWRYGYFYVIGISLLVAIVCLIYFKKKKFM